MNQFVPSIVMGFREGLEAFLLIAITLQYLSKIEQVHLKPKVAQGVVVGVVVSAVLGLILSVAADSMGGVANMTKAWESIASFFALCLVTFFIVWMIKHGSNIANHIKAGIDKDMSGMGVFLIAFVVMAREGTEIAIFSFAGKYPFEYVAIGLFIALVITILIYRSLIKVDLSIIFKVTIVYLILQAGFLLGYAIHEGLSSLKGYGLIAADSVLFTQAYNLSSNVFSHKQGLVGIPLHAIFGWYSKPEWLQFSVQYVYTGVLLTYWYIASYKIKSPENL